MSDHVHMLLNVPPKLAVSSVVGYIKEKKRNTHSAALPQTGAKLMRVKRFGRGG